MENNNFEQNNLDLYKNYIEDKESFFAALIAFFVPTIGIILYFLKRRQEPKLASSFRKGVKVNLIILAIFPIIYFIFTLYLMFIFYAIK